MAQARLKETQAKENIFFYRLMQALAKVWKAPWQVKASVLVMGLGQICYGQIIKGLIYLACLAGLIWYFVTTGAADFIGFFTLGTQQEDLWLGIPGDNSMNMLILGIFAIVISLFGILLWITNIKDCLFTAEEVKAGRKPRSFRETLRHMADDKFHVTALTLPMVGVTIFSVLPIVFMILIAFTNLGGDVVYFDSIPNNIQDAARIDGASNLQIFWKITMPLSKPMLVYTALTQFAWPWSDCLLPKLILKSRDQWTVAVGLYSMPETHFSRFAAGSVFIAVPIVILYFFLVKHIVSGLTAGAVKG